jgi:hypothetical protein
MLQAQKRNRANGLLKIVTVWSFIAEICYGKDPDRKTSRILGNPLWFFLFCFGDCCPGIRILAACPGFPWIYGWQKRKIPLKSPEAAGRTKQLSFFAISLHLPYHLWGRMFFSAGLFSSDFLADTWQVSVDNNCVCVVIMFSIGSQAICLFRPHNYWPCCQVPEKVRDTLL